MLVNLESEVQEDNLDLRDQKESKETKELQDLKDKKDKREVLEPLEVTDLLVQLDQEVLKEKEPLETSEMSE